MSWLDQIKTDLKIVTGEGSPFFPNWLNATKDKEYNVAQFEFPNVSGTLVKRGLPKGRKYTLEIYFQGDDHLDVAFNFEQAADDPRAWTLIHPFYGTLIVQPISLSFDNSSYNVTKITGTIVETITEDKPKITINPIDQIIKLRDSSFDTQALTFSVSTKIDTTAIRRLGQNNDSVYLQGKKSILNTDDLETYFNLYNEAATKILNATAEPLEAIRTLQAMINAPSLFIDTVKNRLLTIVGQFNLLRTTLNGISTVSGKQIYENNVGILVLTLAQASATNPDYENRVDVMNAIDIITDSYDQYLEDLDSIQTDNGGEEDSYLPNADSLLALSSLVSYTVSNLFNISVEAKQQRSEILGEDSNVILLAHLYYGLTPDDASIDKFITDNSFGFNELLIVPKNRQVIWFV